MASRKRRVWLGLLLVLLAFALWLGRALWLGSPPAPPPAVHATQPAQLVVDDRARVHATSSPRAPAPLPAPTPGAPVPDDASDVESHCGGLGAFGRCEGDVAKACFANTIYSVDCASAGQRCVITGEGALCMTRGKNACRGDEPGRCDGTKLWRCVDGTWSASDCLQRGGHCTAASDGARCEVVAPAKKPARAPEVEICDGHDNDLDNRVDEQGACDPVPLVAFVPEGFTPSELEPRMARELEILNRVYSPAVFRWEKTLTADASYRTFDTTKIERAARELSRGQDPSFYVAVLYVEDLRLSPPKSGLSTLPNNRCGGARLTDHPAPADGLIVLAEGRQPETLAHEMGHYLGLCHTHEEIAPLALANLMADACKQSGDGMCDTPLDPGPEHCTRDAPCDILCPDAAAHPDASNIMSYYLGCRRQLSYEQQNEAQRNLGLRRDWFRCLDPEQCPCSAIDPRACPMEMSCQPSTSASGTSWHCELDGPAVPGSPCQDTSECSDGSFCLRAARANVARCVRPCARSDECTCLEAGLPFPICAEDLPEARRAP